MDIRNKIRSEIEGIMFDDFNLQLRIIYNYSLSKTLNTFGRLIYTWFDKDEFNSWMLKVEVDIFINIVRDIHIGYKRGDI